MLTVKSRKNQIEWITTDGRIQFSRTEGRWSVRTRGTVDHYWLDTAIENFTRDFSRLKDWGIIKGDMYDRYVTPVTTFATLREAREAVKAIFSLEDNPPTQNIEHMEYEYNVQELPFTVCKQYDWAATDGIAHKAAGWKIQLHRDNLVDSHPLKAARGIETQWHKSALLWESFSTRQAALDALEQWWNTEVAPWQGKSQIRVYIGRRIQRTWNHRVKGKIL